jgi:hypothetical protein
VPVSSGRRSNARRCLCMGCSSSFLKRCLHLVAASGAGCFPGA